MIEINLLPWRERIRGERKKQFLFLLLLAILIGIIILIISYFPVAHFIRAQQVRIDYLQKTISQEKNKMAELKLVEDKKKQIIDQINLIQGLQNNRFYLVRLLDLLARIMPAHAYLTKVEQQNDEILLQGKAVTNSPITELIKKLTDTHWFSTITLQEITGTTNTNDEEKEFSLKLIEAHQWVENSEN